jgi:hypothetical protein
MTRIYEYKSDARQSRLAGRIGKPYKHREKYPDYLAARHNGKLLLIPNLNFWDWSPALPKLGKARDVMSKKYARESAYARPYGLSYIPSGSRQWYSENPADWVFEHTGQGSFNIVMSRHSPVIEGYWCLGVIGREELEDCVVLEFKGVKYYRQLRYVFAIETFYLFTDGTINHVSKSRAAIATFRSKFKSQMLEKLNGL